MTTKVKPAEDTLTGVLQEALEQAHAFEKAAQALQAAKPGTAAYEDAEAELSVEAFWLEMKAEAVAEVLDEAC
jgi:hypothetical protein